MHMKRGNLIPVSLAVSGLHPSPRNTFPVFFFFVQVLREADDQSIEHTVTAQLAPWVCWKQIKCLWLAMMPSWFSFVSSEIQAISRTSKSYRSSTDTAPLFSLLYIGQGEELILALLINALWLDAVNLEKQFLSQDVYSFLLLHFILLGVFHFRAACLKRGRSKRSGAEWEEMIAKY